MDTVFSLVGWTDELNGAIVPYNGSSASASAAASAPESPPSPAAPAAHGSNTCSLDFREATRRYGPANAVSCRSRAR